MRLSLKRQIQIWHTAILTTVVGALAVTFYQHKRGILFKDIDMSLDQLIHPIVYQAARSSGVSQTPGRKRPPRPREEMPSREEELNVVDDWKRMKDHYEFSSPARGGSEVFKGFEDRIVTDGYYATVWTMGREEMIYQSSNSPVSSVPTPRHPGYWVRTVDNERRELYHRMPRVQIVVGRYIDKFEKEMDLLKLKLAGGSVIIILLGAWLGGVLIARSLKPLETIKNHANAVAEGNFAERIPVDTLGEKTELGEFAKGLNGTFTQLEKLFGRQVQFTADASHELRTPLTALMAQIVIGRERDRNVEEYKTILEICQRSAERITRITNDLLELSSFDAGRADLDYDIIPLDALMSASTDELRPMVESKGSKLTFQGKGGKAFCDAFRMDQVVTNLINNALQHNDLPVEISVHTYQEGNTGVIAVIDNGKGISETHLQHLFDRFYQVSASRKSKGVGNTYNVGLGLSICKAIVEAHGGTLDVKSVPNQETRFTITLPSSDRN